MKKNVAVNKNFIYYKFYFLLLLNDKYIIINIFII